jgi:hypothetical protein
VGEKRKLTKREAKSNPLEYERGGRLRKDLRIKMVSDRAGEVTSLVGVSKAYGKVGWRAHFVLFGTQTLAANNFLDAAYVRTKTEVQARFTAMVGKRAKEYLG